jgi:hypothetical protein
MEEEAIYILVNMYYDEIYKFISKHVHSSKI